MNLSDKIDSIEIKVRQLALKLERVQKENAILKQENQELKMELDHWKQKPGDVLMNKMQQKKEETAWVSEGQAEELRNQIDHYIREIDKCIEWLSNS